MGSNPSRRVRVTPLDPRTKCGPQTTVERLYRVEERSADAIMWHLVFFDRHGWYCQHGPTCPAVAEVRKQLERPRPTGRPRVVKKRTAAARPRTKSRPKARTKPRIKARTKPRTNRKPTAPSQRGREP
jgi:hypothetical protein